jgi:hypothetical protein
MHILEICESHVLKHRKWPSCVYTDDHLFHRGLDKYAKINLLAFLFVETVQNKFQQITAECTLDA